ncbi:hypothetical protein, partial [Halalkalicoccus jeotgali]
MTTHDIDISDDTSGKDAEISDIVSGIETCDRMIEMAESRLNGRIRNAEHERIRIQYIKAISTHLRTKRSYLKDRELEEMAETVA